MDHSEHNVNDPLNQSAEYHDHAEHQSFFHTTYGSFIIFKGWLLSDGKATFLTCLFLVFMAICFQFLKFIRHRLGRKCDNLNCKRYILNKFHLIQTALYTIQFLSGYLVMLAVMTYNTWVCIAAIIGLGLGYFFFSWGEYEDCKRNKITVLRRSAYQCTGKQDQELQPLSTDESVNNLLTNLSTGVACSCDNSL